MKEIVFLHKNSPRWKNFQELADRRKKSDPDRLADAFVELTDDLSYARTFYPGSTTTTYLNTLTARFHGLLYRTRREEWTRLVRFWTLDHPDLVNSQWRRFLFCLSIFMLAFFVGVLSARGDDSFARLILGDSYVKMTLENIEKGDPMAVYKSVGGTRMFLGVTINNITVAFLAYVMGVFLSFGTVWILVRNGIMLGVFHYMFYEQGLLGSALRSIWIHGTLEISAILLAATAGIIMGNSILFPGMETRLISFRRGVRAGLAVVVGVIPVFVVAGALEGFVTRHTEMPLPASLAIIILSFLSLVAYYIAGPLKRRFRRAEHNPHP